MNQDGCTRCGKCCMNMRPYIRVGPRLPDGRFSCTCSLSRESFWARVPDASLPLMYDQRHLFRYPNACPFLVTRGEECLECLVYEDRPAHCRTFQCSHGTKKE